MRSKFSIAEFERGFTLLEVVVAMTIVGLGVVTLLEVFSLGLRLNAKSSDRTEAVTRGRSILDELLIRREIREGGEDGSFGGHGRWRLQVKSVRDETRLDSPAGWELREVTLELPYRGSDREKRLELKTLRLVRKGNP